MNGIKKGSSGRVLAPWMAIPLLLILLLGLVMPGLALPGLPLSSMAFPGLLLPGPAARAAGLEEAAAAYGGSAGPASQPAFADTTDHWARDTIAAWASAGYISGFEDGTFRPDARVSRAEFVALVNRSFQFDLRRDHQFPDVSPDAWYAVHVDRAVTAGYITGYEDGTFRPRDNISRQEMAYIVYRLLDLDMDIMIPEDGLERFADAADIPQWSQTAVAAVTMRGLMDDFLGDSFEPRQPVTRAEAVSTLARALAGPDPAARLELDDDEYQPGDTVHIRLTNTGKTPLHFGYAFRVERWDDGQWTDVPLDLVWIEILVALNPGEDFSQELVPAEGFSQEPKPGLYRLVKDVYCADSGQTLTLHAEFSLL